MTLNDLRLLKMTSNGKVFWTDGRTDGWTDKRTERVIESHARD